MLTGFIQIIVGLFLWGVAITVGISWLAFCFGSVIIGILLLIFAPHMLLLPFLLVSNYATRLLFVGWDNINSNSFEESNSSIDSDAVWNKSTKNLESITDIIKNHNKK